MLKSIDAENQLRRILERQYTGKKIELMEK
jgi:hypothetical protein